VGVILSSAQALLWDEERGEYVLHKVGDDLPSGRIVELDADHLVLERGDARDVIEIAAPPQTRVVARKARRMPAMIISAVPAANAGAPVAATTSAPAAPAANATPAEALAQRLMAANVPATVVVVPGAAAEGALAPTASTPASSAPAASPPAASAPALSSPAVTAPVAPAPSAAPAVAPAVAATTPPVAAAPAVAAPAPAAAAATTPEPSAAPTPSAAPAPATSVAPVVQSPSAAAPAAAAPVTPPPAPVSATQIPRADLDRALGDFSALSQQLQVTPQPEGGFRVSQLQPGSFFARVGLRNDDVVLRVDGRPINGVDDAAAAYAWLRVTNRFAVDVLRGGRPMTLRYVITPQQPVTAAAQ
jgi:hypothetical protein